MSLRGTCPECGLRADLVVFAAGAEVNRAVAAGLAIPAVLGTRVLRYLRLFSPPKKVMAVSKAARLLEELAQTIRAAEIHRKGQIWAAPLALWEAALDAVIEQPPARLPLSGHGYLYEVAASLAAKGAGRAERESQRQQRPVTPAPTSAQEVNDLINDLAALKRLEAHSPGAHREQIARLKAALAARQATTPTSEEPAYG